MKIHRGDRITIPKEIMKKFKLKTGDFVILHDRGLTFEIIPADVVPRDEKKTF